MAEFGRALAREGVGAVLLIPGSPPAETEVFCDRLARWLEQGLHGATQTAVPVHLVEWSGETHDLGCTDGAVRLIDALLGLEDSSGRRVLLLAAGQAANLLALACWLIAAGPEAAERLFRATSIYYRWPVLGCVDIPLWERVRRGLQRSLPLENRLLDMVLWGPDARYPWRLDSRMRILHFVQRTPPQEIEKPQQPHCAAWRARIADRRLRRLFESDEFHRQAFGRPATMFEDRMITLPLTQALPPAPGHLDGSLRERQQWLVAQLDEVVRRFYSAQQLKAA